MPRGTGGRSIPEQNRETRHLARQVPAYRREWASAGPSQIIVTSTVKDLVLGSGIEFAEQRTTELKGVPGSWQLYALMSR